MGTKLYCALLLIALSGCTQGHIKLNDLIMAVFTITVVHHVPPIYHNGKKVGGYATWDAKKKTCTIHIPWPNMVFWDDYMYIKGHEVTHCDFGYWHGDVSTF